MVDAPVIHSSAGDITSATVTNSATLIGAKPGNTVDGDVLWAVVYTATSGVTWPTAPTGWTRAGGPGTNGTVGIFSKPIPSAAAETATNYTWTSSGASARGAVIIFRSTGASGSAPLDAIGSAVTTATGVARHNLCINPALKVNATGWGGNGTAPIRTDVTAENFGTQWAARYNSGSFIQTPTGTVVGSTTYTLSAYMFPSGVGTGGNQVYVEWRNASNAATYANVSYLWTAGAVNRAVITATSPADAVSASIIMDIPTGRDVDVTMVLIEPAAAADFYFDGDSLGGSWDGTAGNSASTLTSSIVDPAVTAVSVAPALISVNISNRTDTTSAVVSPPSGMSEVGAAAMSAGGSTSYLEIAAQTLSASGSTGTRTAPVAPPGNTVMGIMFTIAPGVPLAPPVIQTGAGNVTTVTVSSSAIMRCNKPSATADGDVLYAMVYHRNSGAVPSTVPPGWSQVPSAYTVNGAMAIYTRYVPVAADEPSIYTWRVSTGAGRGGVIIGRVTGADPRMLDSYGAGGAGGTTSIVDAATTIVSPAALVLAFNASMVGTTSTPIVSAPSGMVEVTALPIVTGSASSHMEIASQSIYAPGSTGTRTAAVSPAASATIGQLVAFAPVGYGIATPPQIIARLAGGITDVQAKVSYVTKFTTSVRVALSASPSLTSPTYSSASTPDFNGIGMVTFTGLTADTVYYYGYELNGVLDTTDVGTFKTMPTAGVPTSFRFAAASCADTNSNAVTFDYIRTQTAPNGLPARMFIHLGDMHYQDIGVNDQQWALAAWLNAIGQTRQQALYAAMPLAYTWSDHENGASNTDKNSPAGPAVQAVYRRLFPSYDLPGDGVGIYQTWVIGRVRFIMTDGRSYMDPIGNTDNSSKSKLGTVQKAWLKTQLSSAEPVKIWLHEDEWSGANTFAGDDTWTAYGTERAELASYITTNNVSLLYIHGDLHVLAADDGSHVPGKFPIACCSPIDQTPFNGNGTWSQGFSPNPATGVSFYNNYGAFDVHDDGKQIMIEFSGIASGSKVLGLISSFGIKRSIAWGAPI